MNIWCRGFNSISVPKASSMRVVSFILVMACIKLSSFNCKNFNNQFKQAYVGRLLQENDFLLIQEHWLYESQFHLFEELDQKTGVCVHGKSSMDPGILRQGRPYGGSAILWKSNIMFKVEPIATCSERLNVTVSS